LRHLKLAQGAALIALAIAVSVVVTLGLVAAGPGRANQQCTHGLSSIGPVFMKDGKIVGGDTTPHTEACLP
jgi:hypothetical protein